LHDAFGVITSIKAPCCLDDALRPLVDWCGRRFASGVVYFGLSLSTSTLAGNKYVNFFLSGAVEAPAYALTVVVLQKSVTTHNVMRHTSHRPICGLCYCITTIYDTIRYDNL